MEHTPNVNLSNPTENLFAFSAFLGDKFHVPSNMLCNHLFCTISLALSTTEKIRIEIDDLYREDRWNYYNAALSSESINHVIMSQGCIENELNAYKALGILLTAELKPVVRKKVLDVLRHHYPYIYKFAKKHDMKYLKAKYNDLNSFLEAPEAKFDRAVYFYLSFYCFPEWVDQKILNEIAQNIYNFENFSPIFADISNEINKDSKSILKLKNKLVGKYGNINNYLDIVEHNEAEIFSIGAIVENLFHINKLNMDDIYSNYLQLPLDELYMACLKQNNYTFSPQQMIYVYITTIFLQPFMAEYKKAKKILQEHNQETMTHQLDESGKSIAQLTLDKEILMSEINSLETEKKQFKSQLSYSLNQSKKEFNGELADLNRQIKDLRKELDEEKSYHQELNKLREYIFNLDTPPTQPEDGAAPLKDLITDKKIIIVGGPRQWRRKLREEFPQIITLSGTNTSFDLSAFHHMDCILFYTNYMSHAIYNKAMNYIRTNQIKFGYINSTNMALLEIELYEVLKKCQIIN